MPRFVGRRTLPRGGVWQESYAMFQRITCTVVMTAACLLILAPSALAGGVFSKKGKSGQVYTWSAGHC